MYFSFYISWNFTNLKLHYVGCIVIFFPNFIYIIFLVFLLFSSYYLVLFTSLLCTQNAQSKGQNILYFLNNFLVFLSKTIKIKWIEIRTTFFVKISLLSSCFFVFFNICKTRQWFVLWAKYFKNTHSLAKEKCSFQGKIFSKILKKT